jgi:23S rRNA (cytidine1920-2'-O)/16S rRNA (cytidine1409-2'-O)-methyltransferase
MTRRARVDAELVRRGLARSRQQAAELIGAGRVRIDGMPAAKPATTVSMDAKLTVAADEKVWVSRGAHKLIGALDAFGVPVAGRRCLDAGASTGGFTDCLLQFGAARVYAVDVGHGQLHWKLTQDPRVVNLERVNLRHAPPELLPENVDLVVADCSFISLRLILPPCMQFLKEGGHVLALV